MRALIWQNMHWQGFEYISSFKYVRIVNMAEFCIYLIHCARSLFKFWISRVTLGLLIFVNMTGFWMHKRVLNIPGFQVCQVSVYVSITQGAWYAWMWLNHAWINCSDHFEYGMVLKYAWSKFHRVLNIPGFGVWLANI